MRVLFVCSGNFSGEFEHAQPFVHEQMQSLHSLGIFCNKYLVKGKGIWGYLKSAWYLRKVLHKESYDIIHAVYGLSALPAILQYPVKVVTTLIGSDLHGKHKKLSLLAAGLSAHAIYVSSALLPHNKKPDHNTIIPFGVDLSVFKPLDKELCRNQLSIGKSDIVILFAASKERTVKNYPLAAEAILLLPFKVKLIELGKAYSREELNVIFNASDLLLMTSYSEGSPQVIKEAMACNLPIVSTHVGDVKEIIAGTAGCYITTYSPEGVADKISMVLADGKRTNGREHIQHLDNKLIAARVIEVYEQVLAGK